MIVLVHGAWHGSWCWEPVQRRLQAAGVDSLAVDLPGRAGGPAPLGELGLDDFATSLLDATDHLDEPLVLVGHSQGGLTISRAAELAPERCSSLVYLAALLVADGETGAETFAADTDGELVANVVVSDDVVSTTVDPAAAPELFYGDCTPEDVEWALARLVPEPLGIATAPLAVTAGRWGSVPRSYIVCTEDRAVSPELQRRMAERVGVDRVVELAASHSPFLSMPDELAAVLVELAD
jgi:pimeloyl-ACP methyl ester carboxylesterase